MIRSLSPNRAVVFAVVAFVAYWVASLLISPLILRDIFNSLAFGAALIISITWGPAALRAVRENADTGEWQLILAIFIVWALVLLQRLYIIAFNAWGRPDSWVESPIAGFFPYAYMIAGLLFLSAPGVDGESFRSQAAWAMVAAVGIGCLIAGILIGASISTG